MSDKLYVSQWLKIGQGKDRKRGEGEKEAKAAALPQLGDDELDLLFQLVEREDKSLGSWGTDELIRMMHTGLKPAKTLNLLIKGKRNKLVREYISLGLNPDNYARMPRAQVAKAIKYFCAQRDYDNLLLLGRHLVMFKKPMVQYYVAMVLGLWGEYKYGEGGPAHAVSCLIAMGPEVTMQVEEFLKTANVPDAKKRWEESRKKLGV